MTNTCIVLDCTSVYENSGETVYLFHVPIDLDMQKKWVQAIPKTKESLTSEHLVCDKHFLESDICRYYILKDDAGNVVKKVPYDYPRLTETAVPSIFPGFEMRPHVENSEPQGIIQQAVVYNNNPTSDLLTDIAYYSALNDIHHHTHCHNVGNSTWNSTTEAHGNVQPEVGNQVSNHNPMNNEISTTISSPVENITRDSTALVTNSANPHGADYQTAGSAEFNPISTDIISQNISGPQDVSTNGAADIAAQIINPSGDSANVGNGISEHAAIIDSAITRHTIIPVDDSTNNTMDLIGKVAEPASGWDDVIVDEPVSAFAASSVPFVSSDAKEITGGGGDGCCGDGCCGDGCCGDDCCNDCDCDCGDCDCGDCDCGGCDCGGCDCNIS